MLNKGDWNFENQAAGPVDARTVQIELEEIERQMEAQSVDNQSLSGQLEVITDVLSTAEKQLWSEPVELHLDRMNIKRDAQFPDVRRISFGELHNARGESQTVLLIALKPGELPRRDKSFANAERFI